MKENVGGWDRNTRFIVGAAAMIAGATAPLPKSWKLGLIAFGATELITASTRYCPLNDALGINTQRGELIERTKSAVKDAVETVEAVA
jgi:hypothetical protein